MRATTMFGKTLCVAVTTLLLVVGATAVPAATGIEDGSPFGVKEASAATQLGGLNLKAFCQYKWGGNVALRPPSDAGTWVCETVSYVYVLCPMIVCMEPRDQDHGIDTNEACRWQYGSGAYARASNWSDPYSWRCYR